MVHLQVLKLLGLPEADLRLITKDKNAARIHVSFMGKVFLPEALKERIADTQWTHVVAFRPTGQPCLPHFISCALTLFGMQELCCAVLPDIMM